MKKLITLLFIVLGFTITSVYADYTQPTNTYEHTFAASGELHIISKPSDFTDEQLSTANVYVNDVLIIEDGDAIVSGTAWVDSGSSYELYYGFFNLLAIAAYDTTTYNSDTFYGGGLRSTANPEISYPVKIAIEVDAKQPIRPEINVDNIIGNTFDLYVTNYNPYIVTFVADIYDGDDNLILANAYATDIDEYDPDLVGQQQNTKIANFDFLDWIGEEQFDYETTYKIDGYFIKTFDSYQYEPSEKSDRLTVITGSEIEYDVTITYDSGAGDVSGVSSALPRDMLTFEANPNSSYQFSGWNVTVGNETTFIDSSENPLYYEMPYSDIEVEAIFTQRISETGYKTFFFTINQSGKRYTSNDPDFFTEGRVANAIIYIDGVKVVDKGEIIDDTVWLQYYNNPYMENAVELQDVFDTDSGLLTIHYGDGTNFNTTTRQGDVWLWISGGDLTAPFELEILLPEIDPNPKIIIDDVEENVPGNIDAALGLINADNVFGYVTLFVFTVLLVNIALMYLGTSSIIYIMINFLIGVLFSSMGMLPLFVAIIWYGFIGLGLIATIKGGTVSE